MATDCPSLSVPDDGTCTVLFFLIQKKNTKQKKNVVK